MTRYEDEMAALDAITPDSHPGRDARHFRRIVAARKAVEAAEAELREAVRESRKAGDSWTIIGAALDTTRQAAFQRFGGGTVTHLATGPSRLAKSAAHKLKSPATIKQSPTKRDFAPAAKTKAAAKKTPNKHDFAPAAKAAARKAPTKPATKAPRKPS